MTAATKSMIDEGGWRANPQIIRHQEKSVAAALIREGGQSSTPAIAETHAAKNGDDGDGAEVQEVQRQQKDTADEIRKSRLDQARSLAEDDKLLLAAHALRGIDAMLLQPIHEDILREAAIFNDILRDCNANHHLDDDDSSEGGWVRQGEHTGRHNFIIYYKLHPKTKKPGQDQQISCKLETVMHEDLLVPILSVLNESELYSTWLPNWSVPRVRVAKSEKLRQRGRCGQVVNVETEVPWPMARRQVILKAVACDNIDSYPSDGAVNDDSDRRGKNSKNTCLGKEGGKILIRIQSLDCQNNEEEGLNLPPAKNGTVRVKVNGGFVIQKCPADHPLVKRSMQYDARTLAKRKGGGVRIVTSDLILMTFSFCVDPQLAAVPQSFINFFLRTAMGQMWNMFLNVAEDVKDGKRPEHNAVIERKRDALYDWVEERARVMLGREHGGPDEGCGGDAVYMSKRAPA